MKLINEVILPSALKIWFYILFLFHVSGKNIVSLGFSIAYFLFVLLYIIKLLIKNTHIQKKSYVRKAKRFFFKISYGISVI